MASALGRPPRSPMLERHVRSLTLPQYADAPRHPYAATSPAHWAPMWAWFEALGYEDQHDVLCFVDAPWIGMLRTLHSVVLDRKHEDGVFLVVPSTVDANTTKKPSRGKQRDPKPTTPLLERCAFVPWASLHASAVDETTASPRANAAFMSASRQLLASVRLWDHDTYADGCWIKRSGCIRQGAFQHLLELVLQHGYRRLGPPGCQDDRRSAHPEATTLSAFVALRVLEHLIEVFRGTVARSLTLSARFDRLLWLWEHTSEADQKELLTSPMPERIQRLRNAADIPESEMLLHLAGHQLLDELENNVLNDARFVAESLYTSTLSRCGTAIDLVAREIGHDLQAAATEQKSARLLRTKDSGPKPAKTRRPKSKKRGEKKAATSPATSRHSNDTYGDDRVDMEEDATAPVTSASSKLNPSSPTFVVQSPETASTCSSGDSSCQVYQLPDANDDYLVMPPMSSSSMAVLRSDASLVETFTLALHDDILDMYAMLQDIVSRRRPWQICVVTHLKECVARLWPNAEVHVFGSFATGLSCPKSDVDLLITGAAYDRKRTSSVELLASLLRHEPWVQAIQVIERTTIPLVKVTTAAVPSSFGDAQGVIRLDISFDQPQHRGIETCMYVQRLVSVLPELPPLMLVLKQLLLEHDLNDSYSGGLSSYALTLLLASVLRPLQLVAPAHRPNLGELLLHFLQLFGRDFDPQQWFVRSTHGGPLIPLVDGFLHGAGDVVVVEDPLRPEHNVAKASFGFSRVQQALLDALLRIEDLMPTFAAIVGQCAIGGYATPEHDLHAWATGQEKSVLGAAFQVPHHVHLVQQLRYLWSPLDETDDSNDDDENPLALEDYSDKNDHVDAWAADAADLLDALATSICVACHGEHGAHRRECPIARLLARYEHLVH
ncbi:hypothetical protein SDRG_11951 [Saprolegnia diclina VS20]|uniref:Poly(A) RNA polymerase mitochondrial-like central palm domain-containing protein n=1 Tax=Saprolegnia diclina (strain VS20) TaxID=1156394 RepID=T0PXV4_SAPDV|nr:hypothetical protein SDRG_11951 [Saprolegnia diclina VS20]EQC30374.1 hypothetical protein SDRG_11951 [Saprolegnia diclina VS20]|eukprot:XP_008616227.1 hypothetical protein SDRG_11951 [Saprolegnia diclina VS20]